jgi:glutathione synthase/RimK-type ligase-like ATP-grasp enzyme
VILSRLQRFFPEDFSFTPASFLLPDEVVELEEYIRKNPGYTFIAKPSKGRGGDGIFLIRRFQELPRSALTHDFLVQRYIENPYLMDKKKFDLRLYVVIKGVDPLQAYLCDEGLARFCTVSKLQIYLFLEQLCET